MTWLLDTELRTHGITGHVIGNERIYTRTLVLWAVGMHIDIEKIWLEAPVRDHQNNLVTEVDTKKVGVTKFPATTTPVIRMMCRNGQYKGTIAKRMNAVAFKSVLSLDIQCADMMPNVKISARNTIQITGCCSFELLKHILMFFVSDQMACGFTMHDAHEAGFIIDILLSNLFFRLSGRVERNEVCKAFQTLNHPTTVACYEPLTRDPSVTIKMFDKKLPHNDEIYIRWFYSEQQPSHWQSMSYKDVRRLLPIRSPQEPSILCTTFRVFGSGSVVQVGRWPSCMLRDKQIIDNILQSITKKNNTTGRIYSSRQTKIPKTWFNKKTKQ